MNMNVSDKFMVTNHIVEINLHDKKYAYTVILFDYVFWAQNIESAIEWMKSNFKGKWYYSGMLIGIQLESDTIMFALRYS